MSSSTLPPPRINKQEWSLAADSAKDAAASMGEMAGHAAAAVGQSASQAARDVGDQADDLTARAGVGIQGLGDRLSENAPHEGMLGDASQRVARAVQDSGKYLEDSKLSGMAEDVTDLIRQHPIPAILLAMGLGWFVARLVRS